MSNQNLDVLIVEDSLSYALELEMICADLNLNVLESVANSASALDVIFAHSPDLILMDIEIGGKLSGLELGEKINHLDIPIIFITSHSDKSSLKRALNSNIAGYLIKPISEEKIKATINELIGQKSKNTQDDSAADSDQKPIKSLYFLKDDVYQKINLSEILYVESNDNYCQFHFQDGSKNLVRTTMKEVESNLHRANFMRCHRKYLINCEMIDSIDIRNNLVVLNSDAKVAFSRGKKEALLNLYKLN